ncbi:NrfD/PsrC family molybdoenzyme membrane anchor subunit [Eggerthella sinensis]|uniref:NrfD/PsrC family molybdoenzyme membrane anchor subunit n=1 Tax=Eggerthella sinensis TaxID=242230 RepID=UPI0022E96A01|nr:NrfD/PsrC family molybdoenzyme membrane anchor subunit [Eggerthella sinensis]
MVWDGFVACYLFLAGLGAGAFVLGVLTNGAKKPAGRMKKIAFVIALVAVAVGTLVLVFDAKAGLGNPMRFFLLVMNLSSVMSWGVIILSAFLIVVFVDLVLLLVKKKTPKALDAVGLVLSVCVAAYTGVLLGDAGVAFPLWNMAVLPILFVVSAASTGFAAVLAVTHLAAPDEAASLPFLAKTGLVLPVLELVLVAVLLAVTASVQGSAAEAAAGSVGALVSGGGFGGRFGERRLRRAVLGGFVGIGLVLPFCLELAGRRKAGADEAAGSGTTRASCCRSASSWRAAGKPAPTRPQAPARRAPSSASWPCWWAASCFGTS